MTKKIYLEDTYQFDFETVIEDIGTDERGAFLILESSVFYPQSGGQPSDHGIIKGEDFEIEVIRVMQIDDQIIHYIAPFTNPPIIASKVFCSIDKNRRMLNARYHTAAHLLGNIVEILYPGVKAIKGHSFPGEGYVEFYGSVDIDITALQNTITEAIARNDKTKVFEVESIVFEKQFYKLPYIVPGNKKFRAMGIGDMLPVPCGGTHVSYIGEIIEMTISKIRVKDNNLRISYRL